MFTTSEDLRAATPEVSLPLHASVSVSSAACAVDRPSITARAMKREQGRSIRESPAGPRRIMSVTHSYEGLHRPYEASVVLSLSSAHQTRAGTAGIRVVFARDVEGG